MSHQPNAHPPGLRDYWKFLAFEKGAYKPTAACGRGGKSFLQLGYTTETPSHPCLIICAFITNALLHTHLHQQLDKQYNDKTDIKLTEYTTNQQIGPNSKTIPQTAPSSIIFQQVLQSSLQLLRAIFIKCNCPIQQFPYHKTKHYLYSPIFIHLTLRNCN